jgi:hypothetical protein
MSNIEEIINKLYKQHKNSYISGYGTDVVISIVIIYIYLAIISRYYLLNHLPEIRSKWPTQRCNPLFMPFAGIVVKDSNKTKNQLIEENFSFCIQNILQSIAQDALAPIYYARKIANDAMNESVQAAHSVRSFFSTMRHEIADITSNISGRTLNVMIPILHMFVTTRDSISRVKGVYTAGIYTMMGSYMLMKSTILNILNIIVNVILAGLVGTIVGLLVIPFVGWALAAPLIGMATAIMIPVLPIIVKFDNVFKGGFSTSLPHW